MMNVFGQGANAPRIRELMDIIRMQRERNGGSLPNRPDLNYANAMVQAYRRDQPSQSPMSAQPVAPQGDPNHTMLQPQGMTTGQQVPVGQQQPAQGFANLAQSLRPTGTQFTPPAMPRLGMGGGAQGAQPVRSGQYLQGLSPNLRNRMNFFGNMG